MIYLVFVRGLTILVVVLGQEVLSRPVAEGNTQGLKYLLKPYTILNRRQEVVAVPPVATSILEGPYLPPADAENELFVGPNGVPSPLHRGYPLFPESHILHQFPVFPRATYHGYYPQPSFNRMVPWGLRHGYHTHWPHMQASGPVFLADPNDGMYQEPITGALIPRPIIPPQYPGLYLNHVVDMQSHYHPGPLFLGGHGRSIYPADQITNEEDQILDDSANLHRSAPNEEKTRNETEHEIHKLMEAMRNKSTKKEVKKQ